MDEGELWLSEEDEYDGEDLQTTTNPFRFDVSLAPELQTGGYHVRNRDANEKQRKAVSVFHGGSKKNPAFTVSCNAKVIIHGFMSSSSEKRASLLVYEFKFNSYRQARITQADVLLEFHPRKGLPVGPTVTAVRPYGVHKMEETTENDSSKFSIQLSAGPEIPAVDAGVALSKEDTIEKTTKHHTVVTGDNPQSDDWGNYFQARFYLSENESQKAGIPSKLTSCILLEREDDAEFECRPFIEVKPDLKTMVTSLFSSRAPDDPVIFDPFAPPFNDYESKMVVDSNNLSSVDLDQLWSCTMYTKYANAVKVAVEKQA